MKFIADFHIHSHYSRATSPEMNIVSLSRWGQIKGIAVMGTGDFTHPLWLKEMEKKLEPAEPGLFTLRATDAKIIAMQVPSSCRIKQRFILTVEVSCIYKKAGRVRKLHCILVAPSFTAVKKINTKLAAIGNIKHDGRPILGLDAKELLKIVLDASPDCWFIPAHAWTPHFSVFGSMSGFNALEDAFDELTPHIFAIETGLSSDPPMNWQLSALDNIALVSNSDAHSPQKLGREANVFNTTLSYNAMLTALRTNDHTAFASTIEFFPEEGKYHLDGHRLCDVRLEPKETKRLRQACPKCGKPVTIGVLHRVDDLADRPLRRTQPNRRPYQNIIPLQELIAELVGTGVQSKRVQADYWSVINRLGNEFFILTEATLTDIAAASSPQLAEAIKRMRAGNVQIAPGYDGEYGKIHVMTKADKTKLSRQATLL